MNDLPITTNTDDWNDARVQLAAYLDALGLASHDHCARIVQYIIERAAQDSRQATGARPGELAMTELRSLIDGWFSRILGPREHIAATGLVLFRAIDAHRKWPDVFLADEVPTAFYQAMRQTDISAAPDLAVSSMVPQPFANPLPETITLPGPLAGLARELSPIMTKLFGFILAALVARSKNF